jgi:hydrogenase expression/formation protein HypE
MITNDFSLKCPLPIARYDQVTLAHGGGGRLGNNLVERIFGSLFANPMLDERHDGAVMSAGDVRLAFSTDTYVVRPLFFPGGDIGTLAVNGTANDLAMCGARPQWLSCGFILEEGVDVETVRRIAESMAAAADASGVKIVTGDTKVVDRGKGDGVYVNTAGVGVVEHGRNVSPSQVQSGDAILLSGDIGRHGMAIMAAREGLEFESAIESDCAPLWSSVSALLDAGIRVHCLRDLTRGGLSSALCEISEKSRHSIHISERAIGEDVRGACEILGLDPLYVANEGRYIAIVAAEDADRALALMRSVEVSADAQIIGAVKADRDALVTMTGMIGAERIVDMLSGEQLPRIC